VTRDYDEEEKGFNSDNEEEMRSPSHPEDDRDSYRESVDRGMAVDMDTSD
jgi:hypothetical protein